MDFEAPDDHSTNKEQGSAAQQAMDKFDQGVGLIRLRNELSVTKRPVPAAARTRPTRAHVGSPQDSQNNPSQANQREAVKSARRNNCHWGGASRAGLWKPRGGAPKSISHAILAKRQ